MGTLAGFGGASVTGGGVRQEEIKVPAVSDDALSSGLPPEGREISGAGHDQRPGE